MRHIYLFIALLLIPAALLAQFGGGQQAEEPDVRDLPVKERFFVGGFLGLQFGNFTAVNVSTHAGFRLTNRLSAGIGGSYQFANDRWLGQSMTSHTYGGGVFARFRIIENAFVHAENEWLNLQSRIDMGDPGNRQRITESNFLLGPGYGFRMGQRARLNILILYNFNKDSRVYYDNPFFRAGVDIYLR